MWSLRATSCARKLAQPARLLGILFLITASLIGTEASALSDQREASLKATHGREALLRGQYQEAERLLTEALQLFTIDRISSPSDVLFNSTGGLVFAPSWA